jgi:enoyl-CoA hydratase/carnithine racemase
MHATAQSLASCRHPLVAQIHGICVGGGLEIAGAVRPTHLRRIEPFRSADQEPRARHGVSGNGAARAAGGAGCRFGNPARGRIFGAAEAKEKRLVTRVVPDDDVASEALATAQRIAEGAPLAARWHKKFARRLGDPRPIAADEHDECFDCFDTEDFRIGYAAFLAKRKPEFVGR